MQKIIRLEEIAFQIPQFTPLPHLAASHSSLPSPPDINMPYNPGKTEPTLTRIHPTSYILHPSIGSYPSSAESSIFEPSRRSSSASASPDKRGLVNAVKAVQMLCFEQIGLESVLSAMSTFVG